MFICIYFYDKLLHLEWIHIFDKTERSCFIIAIGFHYADLKANLHQFHVRLATKMTEELIEMTTANINC